MYGSHQDGAVIAGSHLLGGSITECSESGKEMLSFMVEDGYQRLEKESQLDYNPI